MGWEAETEGLAPLYQTPWDIQLVINTQKILNESKAKTDFRKNWKPVVGKTNVYGYYLAPLWLTSK